MSTSTEQNAAGGTGNTGNDTAAHNNDGNQQGQGAQQNDRLNRRGGRGRGNRGGRGGAGSNRANNFKGATASLSGKVFQLQTEQSSTTQFQDTMDALQVFVATTYTNHVAHLSSIFNNLEAPAVARPTPLPDDADQIDIRGFEEDIKAWRKDVRSLNNTTRSLYNVVWGQCSPGMQARLRGLDGFEPMQIEGNVTLLLREIRSISMQFEGSRIIYVAKDQVMKHFYTYVQKPEETNVQFLKNFKRIIDVIRHYGGEIPTDRNLCDYENGRLGGDAPNDLMEFTRARNIAISFLHRADTVRYASLLNRLSNDFALGRDNYPTTLTGAFDMLQTYRGPRLNVRGGGRNQNQPRGGEHNVGMQFAQTGTTIVPGRNGREFPRITCHNCGQVGHYSNNCPEPDRRTQQQENGNQFAIHGVEIDISSDDSSYGPVIAEFMFAQRFEKYDHNDDEDLYYDRILIDTGSTCSVFCNDSYLLDIHNTDTILHAKTNGGHQDSSQRGFLPGFFDVWFNNHSLVNILAWCDVAKHFRITTDTSVEDAIFVHIEDGCTLRFIMIGNGLFLLDEAGHSKLSKFSSYSFNQVDTVRSLKSNFTRREIEGAERARTLFRAIGMPSYQKFIHALEHNHIRNCPVTAADVRRALHIYGPEVAVLKGKSTRTKPAPALPTTIIPLPKNIKEFHSHITLYIDFFFVNRIPFFHSISGKYQFRTVEAVHNRTKNTMLECYNKIKKVYNCREISIDEIQADGEFKCITEDVRPSFLHTAPPNDHVPEVERSIRTIKERVRCYLHDLPYQSYPKIMIEGCVYNVIKQLNSLPADNGISTDMSPNTLITGAPPPEYDKITRITYGTYVQIFSQSDNSTAARKVGAIALYPEQGSQGGWNFVCLDSGKKIYGNNWNILPITDEVINRVHLIAKEQKQKPIKNGNFQFEWAPNNPIVYDSKWDEEDEELSVISAPVETPNDNPTIKNEYDGNPTILEYENNPIAVDTEAFNDNHTIQEQRSEIKEIIDNTGVSQIIVEEEIELNDHNNVSNVLDDDGVPDVQLNDLTNDETIHAHDIVKDQRSAELLGITPTINEDKAEKSTHHDIASQQDDSNENYDNHKDHNIVEPTSIGPITRSKSSNRNDGQGRYNLRNLDYKTSINYEKLHKYGEQYFQLTKGNKSKVKSAKKRAKQDPNRAEKLHKRKQKQVHKLFIRDEFKRIVAICMTQMSAKKGIKKHGDVAINAILKEYAQLHDLDVFKPRHKNDLSEDQLKECLRLITLIKEKRCGKIKGRACADGRPQRKTIPREEAASPTVGLESLMMTLMVDANEDRDVATADVAGAFLKGNMEDFVLIKLMDEEVDIMCKVDKIYENYVVLEGKHKVLYMQLNKALYGCMKSAIIWYNTFVYTLKGLGFKLNPYDPCVANLTVNGSTLTIVWYVDDCKISHKDSKVVDWLIEEIEKQHGKMTITRGKKHVFVGMDIEFIGDGKVKIMLQDYIKECIDASGMDVSEGAKTPATKNLFEIDELDQELSKEIMICSIILLQSYCL